MHGPSCIYASSRDSNVYGWSVNVDRPQSAGAGPDCVFRGHSLSVASLTGSPGELCIVLYNMYIRTLMCVLYGVDVHM